MSLLIDHYAIPAQNFWFHPLYKAYKANTTNDPSIKTWDGKIRFMRKNGLLYAGLANEVVEFAPDNVTVIDKRKQYNITVSTQDYVGALKSGIRLDIHLPYEYQNRAALKALRMKRGVILHATGSGKTFTAAIIINYLLQNTDRLPILIICPQIQLIEQTAKEIEALTRISKEDIGRYYGSAHETNTPIVIASWQSLSSRKKELTSFFKSVRAVLVDEVHLAQAKELRSVIGKLIRADFRIGFTGTLPDQNNKTANTLIKGIIGPVIDKEMETELIKKKRLSPLNIIIPFIEHEDNLVFENYADERAYLEKCPYRQELIGDIAAAHKAHQDNVLILVEKIKKHGIPLQQYLLSRGISSDFIQGNVSVEDRERVREKLSQTGSNVTIATYGTFQLGINIPRLHAIIMPASTKSKIRTVQSIGRGLRIHPTKTILTVYDFADSTQYSSAHLQQRIDIYIKREFPLEVLSMDDVRTRLTSLSTS